jgi:tetratricopeptide (TPR) repeat protein
MEKDTEKVESIFDYNPTERELVRFGVEHDGDGHYEERLAFLKELLSKKTDYYYLGLLFSMRGDKKRAEEYFAKATYGQRQLLIQDF